MDDLINRKALLHEMEKLYNKRAVEAAMTGDRACGVTWNDAVYLVTVAPIVSAEPKVAMRYKPVCKYGKYHCINDPAYIQYAHPKWYEELSKGKTPEELMKSKWCRYCKNGSEYDDEDK